MCQAFHMAARVECYHSVTVSLPTFPGRPKHEEEDSIADEASPSCLKLAQRSGLEFPLLPHGQFSTQKKESHSVATEVSRWCLGRESRAISKPVSWSSEFSPVVKLPGLVPALEEVTKTKAKPCLLSQCSHKDEFWVVRCPAAESDRKQQKAPKAGLWHTEVVRAQEHTQ